MLRRTLATMHPVDAMEQLTDKLGKSQIEPGVHRPDQPAPAWPTERAVGRLPLNGRQPQTSSSLRKTTVRAGRADRL